MRERAEETQCCDLAWSRRALLVMEASEPSLKRLKISIETFKEMM